VNTKIYKIFKTAAGRPADGRVEDLKAAILTHPSCFLAIQLIPPFLTYPNGYMMLFIPLIDGHQLLNSEPKSSSIICSF
jgi:hypothetical protein